ncbi:hypothetical protein FAVG1_07091 [Fusarium avenaceum]|nr:hypothetical protein FAVG1_07091 [Fusarium avenaceum]
MVQKRACDACHKRKIQCDSGSPNAPCNWCEHQGLECTFNRVRGRKKQPKPRSKQTTESLSERLARVEKALSQALSHNAGDGKGAAKNLTPNSQSTDSRMSLDGPNQDQAGSAFTSQRPSSLFLNESYAASNSPSISHESPFASHIPSPAGGLTNTVSYGQIHYLGCHFGHISQHNGMPLLTQEGRQWIIEKTGQDVMFDAGTQHWSSPAPSPAPADLIELPDRALTEKIFDVFIRSSFSLVFPVVDRELFKTTIEIAYQPFGNEMSLEQLSAKAYILEVASITTLQVAFMLNMHEVFCGRLRSGAVFQAIACRMVFTLGGHTHIRLKPWKSPITRTERERRQLRMLFWLCYIFDKDIALRTGQPPLMSDDYCDLTLPENYLSCYSYLPELDMNLPPTSLDDEGLTPHLPCDPRLSHIKERTSRLLYSAQAAKKTPSQLLRDIRELDEELEAWRISIPPVFRPALSIYDESQVALEGMHIHRTIHRVSGRCMGPDFEAHSDNAGWGAGVASSVALSLEASRSTLVYLRAAVVGLTGEAFWIIVFYPTAAMITLFFNILMHPLDERAERDLELLNGAAELISSLPVQRLTPHEISHMKLVSEFSAELVRLFSPVRPLYLGDFLGVLSKGEVHE